MKCSRIRRRLSAFLDGEVTEEEKQYILEHLKSCPDCQRELEALHQVSDSLDYFEEIEPSPYFMIHLKQRIAEREARSLIRLPFVEWTRRVAVPVGAMALVIFFLLLGGHLGKAIYQTRAESESRLDKEFADLLCVNSLDDFSSGSLNDVYNDLLTGEGK
ncbi:MAG: anti-sigma factor [bacterium]|nr:anti-sigma factor [bacterium]